MGDLHITEFNKFARDANGNVVPVPEYGDLQSRTQRLATNPSASAQSTAVASSTKFVRLTALKADVFVRTGPNPTATTDDFPVAQNDSAIIPINGGDKIAAIDEA